MSSPQVCFGSLSHRVGASVGVMMGGQQQHQSNPFWLNEGGRRSRRMRTNCFGFVPTMNSELLKKKWGFISIEPLKCWFFNHKTIFLTKWILWCGYRSANACYAATTCHLRSRIRTLLFRDYSDSLVATRNRNRCESSSSSLWFVWLAF